MYLLLLLLILATALLLPRTTTSHNTQSSNAKEENLTNQIVHINLHTQTYIGYSNIIPGHCIQCTYYIKS